MRNVMMVVPVLITSCQSELYRKYGPVIAQTTIRPIDVKNATGWPARRDVTLARLVNIERELGGFMERLSAISSQPRLRRAELQFRRGIPAPEAPSTRMSPCQKPVMGSATGWIDILPPVVRRSRAIEARSGQKWPSWAVAPSDALWRMSLQPPASTWPSSRPTGLRSGQPPAAPQSGAGYGTPGPTSCSVPAWQGEGAGGGYRSYVLFDDKGGRVAVVLVNNGRADGSAAVERLFCAA